MYTRKRTYKSEFNRSKGIYIFVLNSLLQNDIKIIPCTQVSKSVSAVARNVMNVFNFELIIKQNQQFYWNRDKILDRSELLKLCKNIFSCVETSLQRNIRP